MAEPMDLDQYLALVRNKEITTISHEAADDLVPWIFSNDFVRIIGEVLLEDREEPLPIQTLSLWIHHVAMKSAPALTNNFPESPADYPILQYLRSTTTLNHFHMECVYDDDMILPDDKNRISDAIAANESITELTLEDLYIPRDEFFMHEIFEKLASRYPPRVPLETIHLDLSWSGEDWIANFPGFSLYFESLANRNEKLQQLKLSRTAMNVQILEFLLETHFRQTERIDLHDCLFDLASMQHFGSLLRGGAAHHNANDASVDVFIRYPRIVGTLSSLGAFLLPSNGHVKLREFGASMSVIRHVPILAFYLPKSLFLNTLDVSLIQSEPAEDDEDFNAPDSFFHNDTELRSKQLLDGIRRNGSLHSVQVAIVDRFARSRYFSPQDERKVEAWMKRNKQLPKLLSDPRLNNGLVLDDGVTKDGKTDLVLFPPLFTAASVAESMSFTNVLIGLIAEAKDGNSRFGRTTSSSVDHVDNIQNAAHATGETERESSLSAELDEPVRLELRLDTSAGTNTMHDSSHSTANNEAGEESELLGDTN